MYKSTCQRAIQKAKIHAYRITAVHELKEPDREKRAECVYGNRPRTLQDLRNIESDIKAITPEILHGTFRNMERVQASLEAQGGHFQHLL
jgi:hypothetical protein